MFFKSEPTDLFQNQIQIRKLAVLKSKSCLKSKISSVLPSCYTNIQKQKNLWN